MTLKNQALYPIYNAVDPVPGLGTELNQTPNMLKCVFDFTVLGGAVGTVQLLDDEGNPAVLPLGSVITRSWLDIVTGVVSGGAATVALQAAAAADILAATLQASLVAGFVEGKQQGAAANFIKIAAAPQSGQPIKAVIAVAPLTAGKFYLYLEFKRSSTT